MPDRTLTHDCPVGGRTEIDADWKPDGDVLRGECDDCGAAVYGDRSGEEAYTVGLNHV